MLKRLAAAAVFLAFSCPAFASSCYVAEFSAGAPAGLQVAVGPPTVVQSPITLSGSSAQSAAFSGDSEIIRLFCDATAAAVIGGTNPTASVAAGIPIGSEAPEYFAVKSGDKLAVITR